MKDRGKNPDNLGTMSDAILVLREPLVCCEFRPTQKIAKPLELPVISHGQDQVAVLSREHLIGNDIRMGISHALGYFSRREIHHGLIRKYRYLAIE